MSPIIVPERSSIEAIYVWFSSSSPLPTREELRERLWNNWDYFVERAWGKWPECPAAADTDFRAVFADVSADMEIVRQERLEATRRSLASRSSAYRRSPRVVPQAGLEQQIQEFEAMTSQHFVVELGPESYVGTFPPRQEVASFTREYLGQFPERDSATASEVRARAEEFDRGLVRELEAIASDENEESEVVSRTTTARKQGSTLKMDPVYVWGLQSSKPYGGEVITYEVRLNQDGTTSCNCPGWRFAKNGVRTCKHVRHVEEEAKRFFKMFKSGEQLPTVMPTTEQRERLKNNPKTAGTDFGRVIDF